MLQSHNSILQKSSVAPLQQSSSIYFVTSPHIPHIRRVGNTNHFVEQKFNCLSPNIRKQFPAPLNASTHHFTTTQEVKLQENNLRRQSDQPRRVALTSKKIDNFDVSQKYLLGSAPKTIRTQIKFTYQNNVGPEKQLPLKSKREERQTKVLSQNKHSICQSRKLKLQKMVKNKLESSVFTYSHLPQPSIRKRSQELQKLLKQLRLETDRLSQKVARSWDFSKECRTSATQTNTSLINTLKDSEMMFGSYRVSNSEQKSKLQFRGGFNLHHQSLAEKIPTSKHLGKTIILNPNKYDFGGLMINIISPKQQNQRKKKLEKNQKVPTNWGQIKGLLDHDSEENMKESIHCGPDIRTNNYNCELLQSLGRTIKESTVAYHD